jgi:CBS domain-containing protein
MKVRDLMTQKVEFINADATIQETAEKMKELDVGALPVIIADETVGMITDRDIVVRVVAHGLDPEKSHVSDAITEGVTFCNETDDIKYVARLMEDRQIRRVVVKDGQGNVNGIVSLGDLATSAGQQLSGEVVQEVSKPSET